MGSEMCIRDRVLINKTETSADIYCDLVIHDSLGKIFAETEIN